jgi:hypothetical protein
MGFQELVAAAQIHYPSLQIKYKNQSALMKVLGKLLFFNPDFMTNYITTIGDTVYFPSTSFVSLHPISSEVALCHELVHISDEKTYTIPLFALSYLFPQILAPLALFLAFYIGWFALIPFLLLASPLPAPFRTIWERRAYIAALYVQQGLSKRLSFNPQLATQAADYVAQFKTADYYWMSPFGNSIQNDFDQAIILINAGQRPFSDPIFDVLDDLVSQA